MVGGGFLGASPGGLPAGEATPSHQANTGGRHPWRPDLIYTESVPVVGQSVLVKAARYGKFVPRRFVPCPRSTQTILFIMYMNDSSPGSGLTMWSLAFRGPINIHWPTRSRQTAHCQAYTRPGYNTWHAQKASSRLLAWLSLNV